MSTESRTPSLDDLPTTLPLFPLSNAVVMPGCQLPLNIFEPRYLNMVEDALRGDRIVGMVQPEAEPSGAEQEPVFRTGTAGRITFFNETPDGRLLIVLTGIGRFDIVDEMATDRGYRRATVDWSRFRCDREEVQEETLPDTRPELMDLLKNYFESKHLETDWSAVDSMDTLSLVNRLTCALPLEAVERQLLVESVSPEKRMSSLITLLQYETLEGANPSEHRH